MFFKKGNKTKSSDIYRMQYDQLIADSAGKSRFELSWENRFIWPVLPP